MSPVTEQARLTAQQQTERAGLQGTAVVSGAQDLLREVGHGTNAVGFLQRELAHAQVGIEHERRQLRVALDRLQELPPEDLTPPSLRVGDQPEQLACVGQLPSKPGVHRQRTHLDGGPLQLGQLRAFPMDDAPRQQRPRSLCRGRDIAALHRQDPFVQRDGVRIRGDAQLLPEHPSQAVELPYGSGPVPCFKVVADDLPVGQLIGWLDIQDASPQLTTLQDGEVGGPQLPPPLRTPGGIALSGQQLPRYNAAASRHASTAARSRASWAHASKRSTSVLTCPPGSSWTMPASRTTPESTSNARRA